MNTENLDTIIIEAYTGLFYKSLIPIPKVAAFLALFSEEDREAATQTLIGCWNYTICQAVLANCGSVEQKQQFLRMCQEDFSNPEILDFLIDAFVGSTTLISQTMQRTLIAAQAAIK